MGRHRPMNRPILFVLLASTPSVPIDTPPLRFGCLGFVFVPHHRPASATSVRLLRSPPLANRNCYHRWHGWEQDGFIVICEQCSSSPCANLGWICFIHISSMLTSRFFQYTRLSRLENTPVAGLLRKLGAPISILSLPMRSHWPGDVFITSPWSHSHLRYMLSSPFICSCIKFWLFWIDCHKNSRCMWWLNDSAGTFSHPSHVTRCISFASRHLLQKPRLCFP
jgi:hypothetical protein